MTNRRALSRSFLLFLCALWLSVLPNLAVLRDFYRAPAAADGFGPIAFVVGGWLIMLCLLVWLLAIPSLLLPNRLMKLWCGLVLIISAGLGFYSFFTGMYFDKAMLLSVAQTHWAEGIELVSWRYALWVVLLGIAPAWFVWRCPIQSFQSWGQSLRQTALLLGLPFLAAIAVVWPDFQRYASAGRNEAISIFNLAPINVLSSGAKLWSQHRSSVIVKAPIDKTAQLAYTLPTPRLIVLVLGETARAHNHGLNGYERDTNPQLKNLPLAYFPNSQACGTVTAVSVPCIFSGIEQNQFTLNKGQARESLIDLVKLAGIDVIWRDNDSGCKGICAAAMYEDFNGAKHPQWCPEKDNCYDEILLENLEQRLQNIKKDTLLVLHLKGSHGPAYYKRYPPSFEVFKPACKTSEFQRCSLEEIRNAYDNTIVYTDHILARTIAMLEKTKTSHAAALMYVSDHGESLGEGGIYLHGLPRSMAPKFQTEVPMLAWLSKAFILQERWDPQCVQNIHGKPSSHEAVFHSILALLDVKSAAKQSKLDLFHACDPEHVTQLQPPRSLDTKSLKSQSSG